MASVRRLAVALLLIAAIARPYPAPAQPRPEAAFKPYKAVAVVPPTEVKDAELSALRDKIADATKNRDRAALAKLVVSGGFFWDRDGKDAAKGRPGIDGLSVALGLSKKEGVGWDILGGFADLPTAAPSAPRKGVVCVPGEPRFDTRAFDALLKDTQTDIASWTYPLTAGVEVRATPQYGAPVVEKLGLTFVRVLPESASRNPNYIRLLTPSGKPGFVAIEAVATYGNDQLCFAREGGAWKIGGYIGAGEP